MSTNFPTSLDSLINPTTTDSMSTVSHSSQHANVNDAIEALEAKVGANSSAVTTSHDYKLSEVTSTDKAVGKTATQTLTNKTVNGVVLSTTAGSTTCLRGDGTYGAASVSDASYAAKGAVQGLTDAATSGLTISAGVISVNSGTSANKIVKLDSSGKLPAVDGSQLTNLSNGAVYKNGVTTRDLSTASGNQTIAHGAGATPKVVRITVIQAHTLAATDNYSFGTYNGSSQVCVYRGQNSNSQYYTGNTSSYIIYIYSAVNTATDASTASITVDSTNITLAWTKASGVTGTAQIMWEVEA